MFDGLEPRPSMKKPSAEGLAYLLRHQELWPKDFRWNFLSCQTCALGLAIEFWHINNMYTMGGIVRLQRALNMTHDDVHRIFASATTMDGVDLRGYDDRKNGIRPEQIADLLDEWIIAQSTPPVRVTELVNA